ncbi:DUF6415 family natural product biosynthesis protein [Streptomyces sp. NPDC085927]|uniref:DUF6415 family natural product biosynthesis protein n=1 Tax=Streptomyces sp. NPDC085927 TaxID=3365738 RepID=UPI0037CEA81F
MEHRTAPSVIESGAEHHPADIVTMRASAHRLLAPDAQPIGPEDLQTLTLALRGHLELLVVDVEAAARSLPADGAPRACVMAAAGEARMRLRLGDGGNPMVRVSVAMRLARSVDALCNHLERLTGRQP